MHAGAPLAVAVNGGGGRVGLGVAVAVVSAALYDLGYILEKRALTSLPTIAPGPVQLLRAAVRKPGWVAGFVAMLAGLGVQVLALTLAPVSVVQPVLAGGVVALVVVSRAVLGERLAGRERTAGLLVLGAVVAIAISAIGSGDSLTRHVPGRSFAALTIGGVLVAAVLVGAGRRCAPSSPRGLALLALSAGVCYGLGSVAQKAVATEMVRHGVVHGAISSLATGYPWVFVGATAAGLVAFQICLQRHPASLVAPLANVVSGTCAVVGAAVVFGEALVPGGWWSLPRLLGFAGIIVAVAVLGARAPQPAAPRRRPMLSQVEPAA